MHKKNFSSGHCYCCKEHCLNFLGGNSLFYLIFFNRFLYIKINKTLKIFISIIYYGFPISNIFDNFVEIGQNQ